MSKHLEHLAGRVRDDPAFLASALAAYCESESVDEKRLAKKLGCPLAALAPLSICWMPRPDPVFIEDVERIAERFQADADALAEIVRRGQAVLKMRGTASTAAAGGLLAARDKKEPKRRPRQGEAE